MKKVLSVFIIICFIFSCFSSCKKEEEKIGPYEIGTYIDTSKPIKPAEANEENHAATLPKNAERDSLEKYLEISSEEEIYALGRILSPNHIKNRIYSHSTKHSLNDDLNNFIFPDSIKENTKKISFLASASFVLKNDISITLEHDANDDYFMGIGSDENVFCGIFNGNGNTISLQANDVFSLKSSSNTCVGLFPLIENANIINLTIGFKDSLLIDTTSKEICLGILTGKARNSRITNCNVNLNNADVGVSFENGEENIANTRVGGLAGIIANCIVKDCSVNMKNSSLFSKGYDVKTGAMYAMFSVGGIVGFSNPGSNNTDNIGKIGNEILNCHFSSKNDTNREVIYAKVKNGEELTVGGIIGCTFNNFIANACSVNIENGDIIAEKNGEKDSATYGTQAGGIIGRLEHTGEIYNCKVIGNNLNIISKSSENYSCAGGIVGWDVGPYHRNIIPINNCYFDGNGTSKIIIEITAGNEKNPWNALGGIAGRASYIVSDCYVKNVTLVNKSVEVEKCFVGRIAGLHIKSGGFFSSNKYFTMDPAEIKNCDYYQVRFDVSERIQTGNICGKIQK